MLLRQSDDTLAGFERALSEGATEYLDGRLVKSSIADTTTVQAWIEFLAQEPVVSPRGQQLLNVRRRGRVTQVSLGAQSLCGWAAGCFVVVQWCQRIFFRNFVVSGNECSCHLSCIAYVC